MESSTIMVTIQVRRIINANKIHKNSVKWYPTFNEFPFANSTNFVAAIQIFACTSQIPLLSIPMSRLASQLFNGFPPGNLVLSTELKT